MSDAEWVHAPRQARSLATLERFADATRELLEARPFDEITVADIVSSAERTVGSFYARFEDKYAVLHLLVNRLDERVREVVHAFCDPVRWDESTLAEFVAETVSLNLAAYRRSSALFRAALTAAATDERFRQQRLATMRFCADQQKQFLSTRADELSCADLSRASDAMYELVLARLDHELLFGRFTATSPRTDLGLAAELTEQCRHLLGVESRDRVYV